MNFFIMIYYCVPWIRIERVLIYHDSFCVTTRVLIFACYAYMNTALHTSPYLTNALEMTILLWQFFISKTALSKKAKKSKTTTTTRILTIIICIFHTCFTRTFHEINWEFSTLTVWPLEYIDILFHHMFITKSNCYDEERIKLQNNHLKMKQFFLISCKIDKKIRHANVSRLRRRKNNNL